VCRFDVGLYASFRPGMAPFGFVKVIWGKPLKFSEPNPLTYLLKSLLAHGGRVPTSLLVNSSATNIDQTFYALFYSNIFITGKSTSFQVK
jgi:hypothetical protein